MAPAPKSLTIGPKFSFAESEKDGEPRNQVPEEGLKSEESWHEILHMLLNFFRIW